MLVATWNRRSREDIALFLHTSGTTSRPKGVPLTHGNLMASIRNIAGHYQLSADRHRPGRDAALPRSRPDRRHAVLAAGPAARWWCRRASVPPHFWPAVQAHRVTWYSAVPTIHQILLARADDRRRPATAAFASSARAARPWLRRRWPSSKSRFDAPVLEAYAMTEASHQMTSNPLPPAAHKPGSVGRGTNVDVAIMDEAGKLLPVGTPGEVVVRGAQRDARLPQQSARPTRQAFTNGWFRTGDRGVLDADGLSDADRPHQGADQSRRREDLAAGDRRRPAVAPGGRRGWRRSPRRTPSTARKSTPPSCSRRRRRSRSCRPIAATGWPISRCPR